MPLYDRQGVFTDVLNKNAMGPDWQTSEELAGIINGERILCRPSDHPRVL